MACFVGTGSRRRERLLAGRICWRELSLISRTEWRSWWRRMLVREMGRVWGAEVSLRRRRTFWAPLCNCCWFRERKLKNLDWAKLFGGSNGWDSWFWLVSSARTWGNCTESEIRDRCRCQALTFCAELNLSVGPASYST
jgi:hypothetical protein